jgi:hypothetical protein
LPGGSIGGAELDRRRLGGEAELVAVEIVVPGDRETHFDRLPVDGAGVGLKATAGSRNSLGVQAAAAALNRKNGSGNSQRVMRTASHCGGFQSSESEAGVSAATQAR